MAHFKDDPSLGTAALPPNTAVASPSGPDLMRRLAGTYNRLGGIFDLLAARVGIPIEAVLAVWQVESAGAAFVVNHAILRFEVHKFFQRWGQHNPDVFDAHFQFGGRNGVSGKPWTNHKWRQSASGTWQMFHGDQAKEYAVFNFAVSLGGIDAASWSSSFGGPQILGSNYAILGYASPSALESAFQQSERWHVCGFFDYCQGANLFARIKSRNWVEFARGYNGEGQAESYGASIKKAYEAAGTLGF